MILVLVLACGLPVCLLLGAWAAAWHARRQFAQGEGSFRCKALVDAGVVPGLRWRYPRRWQVGRWVHNVLLLQRGRLFPQLHPLAVRSAERMSRTFGDLVALRLILDDGSVITVTADRKAMDFLVGPFLMAELDFMKKAKR